MKLKSELYAALEAYAAAMHLPVDQVINEALQDWVDTVGRARLEVMAERRAQVTDISTRWVN
jgi:hypothetical protein